MSRCFTLTGRAAREEAADLLDDPDQPELTALVRQRSLPLDYRWLYRGPDYVGGLARSGADGIGGRWRDGTCREGRHDRRTLCGLYEMALEVGFHRRCRDHRHGCALRRANSGAAARVAGVPVLGYGRGPALASSSASLSTRRRDKL